MRAGLFLVFVRREVAAALRARWFLVYSGIFLAGGLALATFGLGDTVVYGYRGFAKALAGIAHLALLFVPLMALLPATAAVADDRERGVLEYTLAQPVAPGEVFAGKWAGVGLAVLLALTLGYGAAGAVAVLRGVPPRIVLGIYLFVVLLAGVFVSVGLFLSAATETRARASTLGLLAWVAFVALGTLGILGAAVRWGFPAGVLVAWAFGNPVEAFRMGVLALLDPDLSLLGPVGVRLAAGLGLRGIAAAAALSLALWTGVAATAGWIAFRARPGGPGS